MKRLLWVWLMLLLLLSLSACGGKLADGMQVKIAEGSSGYSTEDIQAAVDVVEKTFKRDFPGCTMTALRYAPDSGKEANEAWAEQYDAEEAMVLYSDFDVDSSGGDGSLDPNSTYTDWSWVLVRENGGAWKIATWGMG